MNQLHLAYRSYGMRKGDEVVEKLASVLLNRDSGTGVILWILKKFQQHLFLKSYSGGCFWIYTFHPDLNLDKIFIFLSFLQTEDEIYNLSHFCQDHVKYFDKVIFQQLKNLTKNVPNKVKPTSLLEMFSSELKFTTDILVVQWRMV